MRNQIDLFGLPTGLSDRRKSGVRARFFFLRNQAEGWSPKIAVSTEVLGVRQQIAVSTEVIGVRQLRPRRTQQEFVASAILNCVRTSLLSFLLCLHVSTIDLDGR